MKIELEPNPHDYDKVHILAIGATKTTKDASNQLHIENHERFNNNTNLPLPCIHVFITL
jgi:hypothetical protein